MADSEKLVSLRIEDGIAFLGIDVAGAKVNTLSPAMTDRFEEILDRLESESELLGAVIHSEKEDNFIVGFDIEELKKYGDDASELEGLAERGHELMKRFETLGVPFVAAIHGNCLGGGLEVALACQARVASNVEETKLGLPEVKLGVIPGAGGTQRLPRLVDLQKALDMILTGKNVSAKKAKKIGLVDDVVHPGILLDVAAEMCRALSDDPKKGDGSKSLVDFSEVFNDPGKGAMKVVAATPARKIILNKAREMVMKNTGGKYPAPLRALEVIETGMADGFEAGLKAEAEAFVELVQTDEAKNLINLFFMKQQVDKDPVVSKRTEPYEVDKIGVLGAGLMGAGIAQVAAYNGYNVRLKDKDYDGLGWGLNYCKNLFDKAVRYHKMTEPEADIAFGRISGTIDNEGIGNADLVIEAVFEDLGLKQKMLESVEEAGDAVFASNTSTIPIKKIAENSKNPGRVLGMHFFSPVHKMPLLEIIRTDDTSNRAVATALEVGRDLGKTCIVVKDGPGFFTSRVIGAYINEAGWILQEGASVDGIDRAMKDWGFPVGPLKLVDEVGMDVAVKAAKTLAEAFEERWDQPTALKALADEGRKGKKNEKGFYRYEDGDSKGVDETVYDTIPGGHDRRDPDPELIQQRCWLAMLNECAYCLEEGIAEKPRDIDIGVIFGLGFPPFRGGILRHADEVGLRRVVDQMNRLADEFGDRLRPADILVEKAEKGETFHQDD